MAADAGAGTSRDSKQQDSAERPDGASRRQFLAGVGGVAGAFTVTSLLGSGAAKAWSRAGDYASRGWQRVTDRCQARVVVVEPQE